MERIKELIYKLDSEQTLSHEEFCLLLEGLDEETESLLFHLAREKAKTHYGNTVFARGLIEFTNYCKNDCYYCGIRHGNIKARRYRMNPDQILDCCKRGYRLGFRTFVLQGGEDPWFTDQRVAYLVKAIKDTFPDCAVTLSIGEREEESYRLWREMGADRYLLRHETANSEHYRQLHPEEMSGEHRKRCLRTLRRLGYQTGCGMMVGSPGQTTAHLAEDLLFIRELQPEMVGMGPFIPHHDTPFQDQPSGTIVRTLHLLAIVRLMLPQVLLPATTALGTLDSKGREKGILAGANVVMPNLSPLEVREKYTLYNNKIHSGLEAANHIRELKKRFQAIGYEIVTDRGDHCSLSV